MQAASASAPQPVVADTATRPQRAANPVNGTPQTRARIRNDAGRPPRNRPLSAASRQPKVLRRALLSKLMSLGAMLGVGAMLVATSLPANAFYSPESAASASAAATVTQTQTQTQSLRIDTAAAALAVSRDAYTVSSLADQLRIKYGDRSYSYTNDPNGTIQWPFAVPVPITSGFGPRAAPCGGCSSYHEGLDLTPGAGAVIQAIADGVVSTASLDGGLGNHVIIDHQIGGKLVQSVYAHMLYGSIRVAVGQTVTVGTEVGRVGSTGASTGAHLHLEIHVSGTPVDPFTWLKANAN